MLRSGLHFILQVFVSRSLLEVMALVLLNDLTSFYICSADVLAFQTSVCPQHYLTVASMYHPIVCQALLRCALPVSCGEKACMDLHCLVPEAQ